MGNNSLRNVKEITFDNNSGIGDFITTENQTIKFSIQQLVDYENLNNLNYQNFALPTPIGSELSSTRLDESKSGVIDKNNNRIFLLSDLSSKINGNKKYLLYGTQFNKYSLKNASILLGYTENDTYILLIVDQNNVVFSFDIYNNTAKKIMSVSEWNVVGGVRENNVNYLYLFNQDSHIIKKYDFDNDKNVFEMNISNHPKIKSINHITTVETGISYMIADLGSTKRIYCLNENELSFVGFKGNYNTSEPILEPVKIWTYSAGNGEYDEIIVFDKGYKLPIKRTSSLSDWNDIN